MENEVTLPEAQQMVDQWIKTIGVRYFSELTNMVILTEEVGELARIIARKYGDQSFKKSDEGKNLEDELADVLFVLICLANQTGTDLTKALEKNLEKKTKRDSKRHKKNKKLKFASEFAKTQKGGKWLNRQKKSGSKKRGSKKGSKRGSKRKSKSNK